MSQNLNGIITWLKNWFYDKGEVDSLIAGGGTVPDEDNVILNAGYFNDEVSAGEPISSYHSVADTKITDLESSVSGKASSTHTHGNLQSNGLLKVSGTTQTSKNIVTDSNGYITAEAKPTIPTKTSDLTNDSGFLTSHQSLTPTRVYNCSSFNSSYINTSATNNLSLYKLGDLYFLRYLISTKTLTYASTDYNINSDSIPSDYRPANDKTFYIAKSKGVNGRIIVKSNGKVTIGASSDSQIIYVAGTLIWGW